MARRYGRIARNLRESDEIATPAQETPKAGSRLGKYYLVREIARGGMGLVYEAVDSELRRRVAVKVLRDESDDPTVLKRLHREAAIAAQLQHPNIIAVHEVAAVAGTEGRMIHFIVMDLVEGATLADLAARKTSLAEFLRILEEVARAVGYAHSKGVVHRDLKPANVLVDTSGRVVLTDFGLARSESFASRLTQSQSLLGTPHYMAPEQVEGRVRALDARTDVYALGVMLYEILTGRLPFHADTPAKLYSQILHDDPPRPSRLGRKVETDLEWICVKAMEKGRARRYADGTELADELGRFRRGEPIRARRIGWMYRWSRGLRRHRRLALPFAAVLLTAAAAVYIVPDWVRESAARRESERALAAQRERERTRTEARAKAEPYLEAGRRQLEQIRLRLRVEDAAGEEIRTMAEEAERQFQRALDQCAELPDAYVGMARAREFMRDEKRSLEMLDRAIAIDPGFATAYLDRARLLVERYWESGEGETTSEEARLLRSRIESDMDRLTRHSSDLTERLYGEALLAFGRGDYERAQDLLGQYLRTFPEDGRAHDIRGHALERLGRLEEADTEVGRAIRCEAISARFYNCRAGIRIQMGRYEKAIADASKAIALVPDYAEAYVEMGRAKLKARDLAGAERDLTKALELKPDYAEALTNRASVLYEMGNLTGALADADRAIEIEPNDSICYSNRAFFRMQGGDLNGAVLDASRALDLAPRFVQAYFNRGVAGFQRGDYGRALADFTRILDLEPEHAGAYHNRAATRLQLRDSVGVRIDATLALHLRPPSAETYWIRALARESMGDLRGAARDARRGLASKPDEAQKRKLEKILRRVADR